MKKLYSTQNWAKAVSFGTAMAALLSSVSPVFAAGVSTTGGIIRNSSGTDVPYPYGSHGSIVFAGDDDFCGVDNVVGRGSKQQEGIANGARITAEQQYERFIKGYSAPNGSNPYGTTTEKVTWTSDGNLINKASYMGTATGGIANALPEAYGVYSFVTGCGASATGNYSTAFGAGATTKAGGAQAFGVSALASGIASVAMGVGSEASGESAVALGGLALASGLNAVALGVRTKAIERYTVAIGFQAEARASGAIAIGGSEPVEDDEQDRFVIAYEKDAIAIGSHANAEKMYSIAIGSNALVRVKDGVAIGGGSVSLTEKGVLGYDPATNKSSTDNGVTWKSTAGAFSIGEVGGEDGKGALTRQITGVAAGTNDTDAVNVAQLKALRNLAAGAWKVSANDTDPTDVNPGNTVDFSVKIINQKGKDNLKIEKSTIDNKHKIEFTLNDHLKLTKVTTGQSSMSDDGFMFTGENSPRMTIDGFMFADGNGPSMTVDGISAGNKEITDVADGTEDRNAVNLKQLNEVKGLISKAGGWKLSVNGGDATDVKAGSIVNFVAAEHDDSENTNIKIIKSEDNKVTFDLNDYIKVNRVETGITSLSNAGLMIKDGPRVTKGGIHAGGKQITGVAEGTKDADAVNYKQLKAVKEAATMHWQLTVNGERPMSIGQNNTVNLQSADKKGRENIKIVGDNDRNVTFDLADNITVTSVTAGRSKMSDDGFLFDGDKGPRITIDGISAGKKKITEVEEGTDNTDAVNLKQLNEVKGLISEAGGWKLSVNGTGTIDVKAGSTVDLFAVKQKEDDNNESENTNIKIVKSGDNKVSFDLSEYIKVGRVETGLSSMSNAGFMIKDGPNMTKGGINAANTKITGVQKGTNENDAVNVSQLNEVKNQIAGNSLVKWDEEEQLITVGKEKEGTKINIANINNQNRVISGVADGGLGEDSKDAINGSQINKISGDVAKYFGGDAAFANGAFVGPRYNLSTVSADGTVKQKVFENVGDALTGLDANVKNVNSRLTYVDNKFDQKFADFSKDALLWSDEEKAFVALHGEGRKINSKITFLKDGDIDVNSTDAINGSQIHSMGNEIANYFGGNASFENGVFKKPRYNLTIINSNSEVKQKEYNDVGSALSGLDTNIRNVNHHFVNAMNDIASYFGGGAGYNENGEWNSPAFQVYHINNNGTVTKKPYDNVAEAFEGVNNTFTNIHNQISNITENSLVKQDGEDGLITVGKATGGTSISIANKNSDDRTLSGVKDGNLSKTSTEAVNGSQLFTTNETVSNLIETLNDVHENISNFFGGGANVLDGLAPTYVISGETYRDVGSAFTGVNISIKNLDDKIIEMKENNLVQQEGGASGVITIGAKTAGTKISVAGVGGLGRTISGVKAAENGDEAVNKDQLDKSIKGISKDALLWSEDEQAFVALHEKDGKKTKSKLKSLLDGNISKGSTDAITGNQLYVMSNKLAAYFGGGAKYENGKWTAPSFEIVQVDANGRIVKNSYNTVAEAFDGINSGMSNINNRIDDVINKVDSDALKWNKDKNAYDAGRNGQPSKIINVVDGKIAEGSKDAVNGGQLWKTNERVTKVENRVTDVENHVKIIDKKVDNISNTIADIGDTVINIENKVDTIDNKVNNIAEDAVRYDRDEKGQKTNKITLKGGDPSEPVMIDNVADGKIEKGSKEAVNGGQLHDYTKEQMKIVLDESKHYTDQRVNNIVIDAIDDAVERANNYTNMKFEALNYSIENVRKEARQAAAIGLAVSNLRYNDTPGKLSVGFGSGLWRSQSAFAFGAGYTSESGSIRSNLSITTSGGHWGIGAGFNMTLN
ncbi:Vomp family autotransporter [Bartonella henselae]|uniref:Vomp family autotransporter n=2 Tax=Bartonella TaxID=773 RepID=UPI001F43E171|nr:Vomp family autotransporter [Bartonella henselae]UJM32558.1 Vomp family autotransporter [Bartonella henselae]